MESDSKVAERKGSSKRVKSLDEAYESDPELLEFYHSKLLEPGWAGELDPYEVAYIKSQLVKSPRLRKRWGFRPSAKRLSAKRIREVARNGVKRT